MEDGLNATLVNFLKDREFDHFTTFTTSRPTSLHGMRKCLQRFANIFDAGEPFGIELFWCAEPFELQFSCDYDNSEGSNLTDRKTPRYHAHGLIKDSLLYNKSNYFHYWVRSRKLGYIDIKPISKDTSAQWYCTKYITKQISDYDFYLKPKIY